MKYYLWILVLTAVQAYAAITYVDATLENTTINGQAPQKNINYIDNGTNDDGLNGLWGLRLREGVNGGYLWNCDKTNDEQTVPLITNITIDGPAGDYAIYGFFLNSQQGNNHWDCAFSIDGGNSYRLFTKDNSMRAETSDFDGSVAVVDDAKDCRLLRGYIGTVTTRQPNEQLKVYVQGQSRGFFSGKIWMDDRTWYEGIGYENAEPRPLVNHITLNRKDSGYRGIWYKIGARDDEYKYTYSGGLGTYCAKHRPFAIYSSEANKTFFCYGGASPGNQQRLWHMVSYFDHTTGQVPRPTFLLDKQTSDAHDNPVISMDDEGYIWIFSTAHGTSGSSYIHKSKEPYNIDAFELIRPEIRTPDKTMPFMNFSYFQPWFVPEHGFECFMTLYHQPVTRTIYYLNTADGVHWDLPVCLAKMGQGSYQTSLANDRKAATAFNYHPPKEGIAKRTNVYYMQTTDAGKSWTTASGEPLVVPLEDPGNPAIVYECESKGRNVNMKDLAFDHDDNPIILFLSSGGWQPGPENNPRIWMVAHWDGNDWRIYKAFTSDNNYDTGSLIIEDDQWTIVAPTAVGPQAYNPGGEMMIWKSVNQGQTWNPVKQLTANSPRNHTYARSPLHAHPDFYAIWADGNCRKLSESNLYFCDKDGNVYQLPREMNNNFERPEKIPLGAIE